MNKKELRKIIKDRKRQYSSSQLEELSLSVLSRLADHESFRNAKYILMYYSLPDEVNTHTFIDEMIALGKTVLLPVVKDSENMEIREYSGRKADGSVFFCTCVYEPAESSRCGNAWNPVLQSGKI